MKDLILLMIAISVIVVSCKKKKELNKENYSKGIVYDTGSPAYDGCGWLIEIDSAVYYPVNINDKFKTDRLDVLVSYEKLNEWRTCGYPSERSTKPQHIKILDMRFR